MSTTESDAALLASREERPDPFANDYITLDDETEEATEPEADPAPPRPRKKRPVKRLLPRIKAPNVRLMDVVILAALAYVGGKDYLLPLFPVEQSTPQVEAPALEPPKYVTRDQLIRIFDKQNEIVFAELDTVRGSIERQQNTLVKVKRHVSGIQDIQNRHMEASVRHAKTALRQATYAIKSATAAREVATQNRNLINMIRPKRYARKGVLQ